MNGWTAAAFCANYFVITIIPHTFANIRLESIGIVKFSPKYQFIWGTGRPRVLQLSMTRSPSRALIIVSPLAGKISAGAVN